MSIGILICLNSLIEIFTVLPAKTFLGIIRLLSYLTNIGKAKLTVLDKLHMAQFLMFTMCVYLVNMISISDIYHSIRSQSLVKFYVIYNMLDVCGRLCYTFGTDSLNALYAIIIDSKNPLTISKKEFLFFTVCLIYVIVHTLVLYFQAVTLYVSFNSSNNALFTLIMSCQFAEIKGNVFKKIDKNSLYKTSCCDIAERFQLSTFVTVIMVRDLLEIVAHRQNNDNYVIDTKPLNTSLTQNTWWSDIIFNDLIYVVYTVTKMAIAPLTTIASEFLIDWLKHAFMLRLNKIDVGIYETYVNEIYKSLNSGVNINFTNLASLNTSDIPNSEMLNSAFPNSELPNSAFSTFPNFNPQQDSTSDEYPLSSNSTDTNISEKSAPLTNASICHNPSDSAPEDAHDNPNDSAHDNAPEGAHETKFFNHTDGIYRTMNISARGARIIEFIPLPLACFLASASIDTFRLASDLIFNSQNQNYTNTSNLTPAVPLKSGVDISTSSLLNLKNVKRNSINFSESKTCPDLSIESKLTLSNRFKFFTKYFSLNGIIIFLSIYCLLFYLKLYLNRKITNRAKIQFNRKPSFTTKKNV